MSFSFKKLFPEEENHSPTANAGLNLSPSDSPSDGVPAKRPSNEPTPFDGTPGGARTSAGGPPPFAAATTPPESAPAGAATAVASPFAPASPPKEPSAQDDAPGPPAMAGPEKGSVATPFAAAAAAEAPAGRGVSPFAPASAPATTPNVVTPFQAATGGAPKGGSTGLPVDSKPRPPEDMKTTTEAVESDSVGFSGSVFAPASGGATDPSAAGAGGTPQMTSSASPFAPAGSTQPSAPPPAVAPSEAEPAEKISLNLRKLLVGLTPEVLGFDAMRVPEAMQVDLPAAGIRAQVPTGKASVSLREIVDALDPEFRPAFAKGVMETKVKVPLQYLQGISGEPSAPAAATSSTASPPVAAVSPSPGPFTAAPQESSQAPASPPFKPQNAASAPSFQPPVAPPASATGPTSTPPPLVPPELPESAAEKQVPPADSEPSPFAAPPQVEAPEAPQSQAPPTPPTLPTTPPIAPSCPTSETPSEPVSMLTDPSPGDTALPDVSPDKAGDKATTNHSTKSERPADGLFSGGTGLGDDVLKPLKWDPKAKSTTLSEAPTDSAPLKMPSTPAFDDEEESQPLDSLPTPGPSVEDLPPAPKPETTATSAHPVPAVPKGPILASKQSPKAVSADTSKTSEGSSATKLPQLGNLAHATPEKSKGQSSESGASASSGDCSTGAPPARDAAEAATERRALGGDVRLTKGPGFVLRALLEVNGEPTCSDVVEHCADLSGVAECVVLRSGDVVPSSEKGSGTLAPIAEGAFEKVTGLVREIGIAGADALTIQLESGILNFFVSDDACLAVLQDDTTELGPGVRERLTLISQQVGSIPIS